MPELMETDKDEELGDLIGEYRELDWVKIKKDLPKMSTEELVDLMIELELYVNKALALEIAKREDAVFWLRRMIQDGRHWYKDGPGDTWAPIHAIHILALIKSGEALELLLDTIRYHGEDLGDWLTENVTSLLVSFGADATGRLEKFSEDETLESFARGTATSALMTMAKKFPAAKSGILAHLLNLLNTTKDPTFAGLVADDLASFHDESLLPDIHRAFREKRIDPMFKQAETEDVVRGVYADVDERDFESNTADPLNHFSRENLEHLFKVTYSESEERETLGINEKTPLEEKSIKAFFTDLPEKRGMKNIYKKEEEYAGILAPIELALANCYLQNPRMTDRNAEDALKNFRGGCDKKFKEGTPEFVLQQAALMGLEKLTETKKISEHEFLLAIEHVIWAISNREWIPDERAYLKWICNFFGLLDGEEKEEYERFYDKLGHMLNIPKRKLELLKGTGSELTGEEGAGMGAFQDEDGRLISHKTGRNELCPCGSGRKYKKCCMGKSILHGVGS